MRTNTAAAGHTYRHSPVHLRPRHSELPAEPTPGASSSQKYCHQIGTAGNKTAPEKAVQKPSTTAFRIFTSKNTKRPRRNPYLHRHRDPQSNRTRLTVANSARTDSSSAGPGRLTPHPGPHSGRSGPSHTHTHTARTDVTDDVTSPVRTARAAAPSPAYDIILTSSATALLQSVFLTLRTVSRAAGLWYQHSFITLDMTRRAWGDERI